MTQEINKIQINENIETAPDGKIIKSSILINIRTDDTREAVKLYQELKESLNNPTGITRSKMEEAPLCEECGSPMTLRHNGKKNSYFYGCSKFPNCRFTVPQEIPSC